MSDEQAARQWADEHRNDYATQPARGPLADAYLAGVRAERARWYDLLMEYSTRGSTVINVAGVVQDLAEQGNTPPA